MATRVLVVDDDPTVSNVVSAYLTKAGYDARVVADGVAAVEVWQQWKPSVDPSDPRLVLTVPRTGYRFVGEGE